MDKECYKDIEKIKTIGSTYMAAVGLVPTVGTKVRGFIFFVSVLCFAQLRKNNKKMSNLLPIFRLRSLSTTI